MGCIYYALSGRVHTGLAKSFEMSSSSRHTWKPGQTWKDVLVLGFSKSVTKKTKFKL